jgi:hypothetical protein
VLGVVFLYSVFSKRYQLARALFVLAAVVEIGYVAVLLLFSFFSSEEVLARGEEKHFCEIDCHLAYSIADVQKTDVLSSHGKTLKANGSFYLVTVRTRFDETTISRNRGNGLLYPNPRSLTVIDADGRRFSPSADAEAILRDENRAGTSINTPLRPAESYLTVYVFDLPRDVRSPALLINESDWVTRLIIGHENSIAHKKTSLQL